MTGTGAGDGLTAGVTASIAGAVGVAIVELATLALFLPLPSSFPSPVSLAAWGLFALSFFFFGFGFIGGMLILFNSPVTSPSY